MAKLKDIEPGSALAYEEALKILHDQIEFELDTCEEMLGCDRKTLLVLVTRRILNMNPID